MIVLVRPLVGQLPRLPEVSSSRFTLRGIPGAASLQPWFLFNETQAWSYLAATAGTRLYDTFGTWRKNGRPIVKAVTDDREDERISRGQAFRNENKQLPLYYQGEHESVWP